MIVDTLVTRFTLDASGYEKGAKQVATASTTLGRQIGVGAVAMLGLTSVMAGGFITYAIRAAMTYDTLTRSLTAVTKSASRAKAVLSFTDKLALPSVFTSKELAEAALTLEAFSLKTERFLPIAEKLGTVFGGTAGDLNQFVNALGMLQSGRSGEAFESLARAGISRSALSGRGLEFSKSGEFKGSIDAALNAVEAEVNSRFGKLSQEMASGPAAKMASFMDVVERGARDAGMSIVSALLPHVDALSDKVGKLVSTGKIKEWTEGAIEGVKSLVNALRPIVGFVSMIGGAFMRLPGPLMTATIAMVAFVKAAGGLAGISKIAGGTGDAGSLISKAILGPIGLIGSVLILGAMSLADKVSTAIKLLEKEAQQRMASEGVIKVQEVIDTRTGTVGQKNPRLPNYVPPEFQGKTVANRDATDEERKRLRKLAGLDFVGGEDAVSSFLDLEKATGSTGVVSELKRQTEALKAVEKNTKPMIDLKRLMFGGGDLGALGVTPTELADRNRKRGGRKIDVVADLITKALKEAFAEGQNHAVDRFARNPQFSRF